DSSVKRCDIESDNSKENTDDSLKQQQKTDSSSVKSPLKLERIDDEDDDESNPKVEKKTVIPTATKKEFVKPVKRSVSFDNQQRKRIVSGNNYNKKDNDYYSKTSHPSAHKHMAPREVLMKTGLKSFNTARPVNTVRSVNTGRPFSTARSFNTIRPSYTAHPKSTIHCAKPRTYFQNQAQSTVHMPFYKRTTLTKRCFNQRFNTGKPFRSTVNTVKARGFNAIKPSACWVWRPIKPNGASLSNSQLNDKGFVDSGCSRHMTRNITHLLDFKDFDGGSEGFHQVIDFLNRSQIFYALTKKPDVYISLIKQFWRSAEATNDDNGEVHITATIDSHSKTITKASLRRHLKLDDHDGITSIPNSEIFQQLALMGCHTDSDKLTFQKGAFSPQWRFLIHTILHCLSPKKTAWEQFSSNIATDVISEQHIPTPNESPLHAVHSHRSDDGSLKLIELTNLVTKLLERIGVLEDDLKKTKLTYSTAVTKLILRGRKLSDAEVQEKARTKTKPIVQEMTPTEVIQDQGSNEKGNSEVSTTRATKGTASEVPVISIAEVNISTAGRTVTYRRSEEKRLRKDKGKAIMTEPEPKKKSKKELEQERLSLAEAIRLQEQMDEEQRAHIARDEEIARQCNEEKGQRAMSEAKSSKKIDWNDPSVIRWRDAEKEELKGYLDIIPREDVPIDVYSLSTKYLIVDWKTCVLTENFMYYQMFRGDGSSKNYKVLNLHTLFEPDEESEIWKNQNEYNLISWSLCDFCGVHILLMQNGIAIHMLTEKKYPLSQEMISKMLNKRLEVDHESTQAYELLKFIRSQVQK
ncbi:hypothetical protein Tco_1090586, partial [Tanacetum coccineum]